MRRPLAQPLRPAWARLRRSARGFTLIEVMLVGAIAALVMMFAVPSMTDMLQRNRLRSVAGALLGDLQFARSEAMRRGRAAYVRVDSDANGSCYVIFELAAGGLCDCRRGVHQACTGTSRELRTVQVPASTGVALVATSSAGGVVQFNPDTRIETQYVRPGDFRVDLDGLNSGQLRVAVLATGRPTLCSPNGSVAGVPAC